MGSCPCAQCHNNIIHLKCATCGEEYGEVTSQDWPWSGNTVSVKKGGYCTTHGCATEFGDNFADKSAGVALSCEECSEDYAKVTLAMWNEEGCCKYTAGSCAMCVSGGPIDSEPSTGKC